MSDTSAPKKITLREIARMKRRTVLFRGGDMVKLDRLFDNRARRNMDKSTIKEERLI